MGLWQQELLIRIEEAQQYRKKIESHCTHRSQARLHIRKRDLITIIPLWLITIMPQWEESIFDKSLEFSKENFREIYKLLLVVRPSAEKRMTSKGLCSRRWWCTRHQNRDRDKECILFDIGSRLPEGCSKKVRDWQPGIERRHGHCHRGVDHSSEQLCADNNSRPHHV